MPELFLQGCIIGVILAFFFPLPWLALEKLFPASFLSGYGNVRLLCDSHVFHSAFLPDIVLGFKQDYALVICHDLFMCEVVEFTLLAHNLIYDKFAFENNAGYTYFVPVKNYKEYCAFVKLYSKPFKRINRTLRKVVKK